MILLQAELIPLLKGVNPILAFLLVGMAFIISSLWRKLATKEKQERETFLKVTELLITVAREMEEDKRLRHDVQKTLSSVAGDWRSLEEMNNKLSTILKQLEK